MQLRKLTFYEKIKVQKNYLNLNPKIAWKDTLLEKGNDLQVILTTMSPIRLAASSPRSAALERWR